MSQDALRVLRPVDSENTREPELAMLVREHHDARATGSARFVFVRGPRGVGKSYLVAQLLKSLSAHGVATFESGSGRDGQHAWGTARPMLEELLTFARRSGVAERSLAHWAEALEPLRAGKTVVSPASFAGPSSRVAAFDAAAELLSCAARAGGAFVFHDLEVADLASLELVRYVAAVASTPSANLGGLFVLTFRDDTAPLPAPLSELLARVPGRTLPLAGLDAEGLRKFLGREEVVQRLLQVSAGNPERLVELIERPVPAADFFSRRVERLTAELRDVLSVLCLVGHGATVAVIAQALGLEPASVAQRLDQLQRERLVTSRHAAAGTTWSIPREPERLALHALVEPASLRSHALALGEALAASDRRAALELLWPYDAQRAAQMAVAEAASLMQRGALEDADLLLARAEAELSGPAKQMMFEQWGRLAMQLGDYASAARRLVLAARTQAASAGFDDRPGLWLEAARASLKRGWFSRAAVLIARAEAEPALRFEAMAVRCEHLIARGRASEAKALASAALSARAAHDFDETSAALRHALGRALLLAGAHAEAAELFAALSAQATSAGLSHRASMARLNEGVAAFKLGLHERAVACWTSVATDDRPLQAHAEANLGSLFADSGDFELAHSHLQRALASFSRFGSRREVAQAANNLARLLAFLGEHERATELAEHARSIGAQLGDASLEAAAELTAGTLAFEKGDSELARRRLESARTSFERLGNDGAAALASAWKARSHLAAGERAQAELELERPCVARGVTSYPAAALETALVRAEASLSAHDLLGAGRAIGRAREALLEQPDLDGPITVSLLNARLKQLANESVAAQAELQRAGRLLDEVTARVAPHRRSAFLAVRRRAEVVALVEPTLRLPRAMAALAAPSTHITHGLVGRSPALERITKQLEPIGRSNATVLVRGESGTGKERLADALHALSPRRHMPLVKVNCAAMVEELLLSELFGHEKGAFTGAIRERKGRFELADGGTIFLDEIGDISPKAQVALLRVLQEREFERVGGTKTLKVDVRIICATNRDLEALIREGRFRSDLYYRLKGVMLELPPLRARPEDLLSLVHHFLERAARERGEPTRRLTPEAQALLLRYRWPGNVRELENVIAAASIFAEGPELDVEAFAHVAELRALADDAPPAAPVTQPASVPVTNEPLVAQAVTVRPSTEGPPLPPASSGTEPVDYYELARARDLSLKELRHEVEMQCIRRALEQSGGNISEAARLLKMKRSRLSQIVNGEVELKEVAHGDE